MARIVLFANTKPGIAVAKFLAYSHGDEIIALYLCNKYKEDDEDIVEASMLSGDRIFSSEDLNNKEHLEWLEQMNADVLITVYWPYLLKERVFSLAKKTVNFHPALLPINRGWFPHVHSILDGTPTGVTLHAIDKGADTGPIWVQKEVPLKLTDTSKEIYLRLQSEIVEMFKQNWEMIRDGIIKPQPQIKGNSVYHEKHEINNLDEIKLEENFLAKDMINLLRARSFGNKGYAYFKSEGSKIYINIRLSNSIEMEEEKN